MVLCIHLVFKGALQLCDRRFQILTLCEVRRGGGHLPFTSRLDDRAILAEYVDIRLQVRDVGAVARNRIF